MTPAVELLVDGSKVTERALTFPDQAKALTIVDAPSYSAACEFLKGIKALREEIADTFDPHIKRAHDAHKALCKEKQDAEAPLSQAERITKDALVAYDRAQERIRQDEQRRLQEQARREEEDRRLLEAIQLENEAKATGDVALEAEAVALLEQPITVPTVAVAPSTPKVQGVTYRETWSAQVTDIFALVKHIGAHPDLVALLTPNMPALNGQARSLKGLMNIPGVKAVCTRDVAAGRR